MSRFRKASNELSDLVELVIKSMISIVVVYLIAKTLIELVAGEKAGQIISAILGISLLFAVIVSKRVRAEILEFGRKK